MMTSRPQAAFASESASFPPPIQALGGTLQRESSMSGVYPELGPGLRRGDQPEGVFSGERVAQGPGSKCCCAGFSLLEVLVAFVVLALVGTALFRVFGASLNNAGAADEYSRAAAIAESRLTAAAVEAPLRDGSDQGTSEDGRYAWTTKIEAYVPPDSTADQGRLGQLANVRLWRIAVTVSWPGALGSERSISLSTVRLAAKQL
jgi:general secretion pathway protein I